MRQSELKKTGRVPLGEALLVSCWSVVLTWVSPLLLVVLAALVGSRDLWFPVAAGVGAGAVLPVGTVLLRHSSRARGLPYTLRSLFWGTLLAPGVPGAVFILIFWDVPFYPFWAIAAMVAACLGSMGLVLASWYTLCWFAARRVVTNQMRSVQQVHRVGRHE